jgi:hypothetical protein
MKKNKERKLQLRRGGLQHQSSVYPDGSDWSVPNGRTALGVRCVGAIHESPVQEHHRNAGKMNNRKQIREKQYPITNNQYPISKVQKRPFSSSSYLDIGYSSSSYSYLKFGDWLLDIGYSSFSYFSIGHSSLSPGELTNGK